MWVDPNIFPNIYCLLRIVANCLQYSSHFSWQLAGGKQHGFEHGSADYHDDGKTVWLRATERTIYQRPVDYGAVVETFAEQQPPRMLLVDPGSFWGSVISQSECLQQMQINDHNFQFYDFTERPSERWKLHFRGHKVKNFPGEHTPTPLHAAACGGRLPETPYSTLM